VILRTIESFTLYVLARINFDVQANPRLCFLGQRCNNMCKNHCSLSGVLVSGLFNICCPKKIFLPAMVHSVLLCPSHHNVP
jgi:hypothetical protein